MTMYSGLSYNIRGIQSWAYVIEVFRNVHPTRGSEFLTAYYEVLQILRMKRHNLK